MGVKGLWKLLEPAAQPVSSLDNFRGNVVAIDVSMWAHRLLKIGIGSHERALLATFSRISKLLYYGIKPVFVFDGAPPLVKLETQRRRRNRREAASERVERLRSKLLSQVVEMHAAVEIGTGDSAVADRVLQRLRDARQVESSNDIFKLSNNNLQVYLSSNESEDETDNDDNASTADWQATSFDDEDDEALINSVHFNELPPEVRHDMLLEMRSRRKYAASIASSHGATSFLPQDSSDFSAFQIKRALAGSKIAGKLKMARQEIAANAVERAGADASLLRRVLFSGGTDKSAAATEIRIETGGASASSEYVFIHNRRQFDNIQAIAGVSKPTPAVQSQAKIDSFPSLQPSAISAPSFMKIGVFDATSYACGASDKRGIYTIKTQFGSDEDEEEDDLSKLQPQPPVVQPNLTEEKRQSALPCVKITASSPPALSSSDDDKDFEDVEFVEIKSAVKNSRKKSSPVTDEQMITRNDECLPYTIDRQIDEIVVESANELAPENSQQESTQQEPSDAFVAAISADRQRDNAKALLLEMERDKRTAAVPEEAFYFDVIELCKSFGLPTVESPSEAEAQAAALDSAGIVNCCLTDDSDYWVFGGQRVIRGLFGNDSCSKYEMTDVTQTTGLDRNAMICIALISGCDYCDGLRGCGPAMAIDIWREFSSKKSASEDDYVLGPLRRFKEAVIATVNQGNVALPRSAALVVDRFLKRRRQVNRRQAGQSAIDIEDISEDSFPSVDAVEAFLRPQVNISSYLIDDDDDIHCRAHLQWLKPDVDRLKSFAKKQWKWSPDRTEAVLAPILRRIDVTTTILPGHQLTLTALWHQEPTTSHVSDRGSTRKSLRGNDDVISDGSNTAGKRRKRK